MHRNRKAKDALHRDKNHASSIELSKFEKKSHEVDDHEKLYIILDGRLFQNRSSWGEGPNFTG